MSQPSPASSSSAAPAKKSRSPVEKLIVWGGIAVLLILAAFQARARFGYTMTLNAIQSRLEEDEGTEAKPLLVGDLDQYIVGWPSKKEESQNKHVSVIELSWRGLTQSFGLKVAYDPEESGGTVMSVETAGYVEPKSEGLVIPAAGEDQSSLPPGAPGGPPLRGDGPAGDEEGNAAPATDAPAESAEPAADESAAAEPASDTPAEESAATAEQ